MKIENVGLRQALPEPNRREALNSALVEYAEEKIAAARDEARESLDADLVADGLGMVGRV